MDQQLLVLMHTISVTISIILLWVTIKRAGIGRFLMVCLFLWAAYINAKTAITNPQDYLNYASYAWLNLYRGFILGWFAQHITPMVLSIASGQLLIALGLASKGKLVTWAAWGAIVFFLAIIPLGVGSGFPTSLIMAVGAYYISRHAFNQSLLKTVKEFWLKPKFKGD